MFKLSSVLFFACLVFFCYDKKLTSKTQEYNVLCSTYGADCDADWFTHYCCGEFKCIDYRCQEKNAKEMLTWAPKGTMCNAFHHCPDHYRCESHRCHPIPGEEAKALLTKLVQ